MRYWRSWLNVLWVVLVFLMQTSPHQAVSNLSLWWSHIATSPTWLRSPNIDRWGTGFCILLIVATSWPFLASRVPRLFQMFDYTLIPLREAASTLYTALRTSQHFDARIFDRFAESPMFKSNEDFILSVVATEIIKKCPVVGRHPSANQPEPIAEETRQHASIPKFKNGITSIETSHGYFTDIAVKRRDLSFLIRNKKKEANNALHKTFQATH